MSKELPPSRIAEQFVVRLPDGMRERIADVATVNKRSMNAEIVARLENSFLPTADAAELAQARATIASLNGALERDQYRRAIEAASDISLADLILALYDALPAERKSDHRFKSEAEFVEIQLYDRLATMIEAGREEEAFAGLDFVQAPKAKAAALARLETRRRLLAELAKEKPDLSNVAVIPTGKTMKVARYRNELPPGTSDPDAALIDPLRTLPRSSKKPLGEAQIAPGMQAAAERMSREAEALENAGGRKLSQSKTPRASRK